MKPMLKYALTALLLLPALMAGTAVQAQPPEDLQSALVRLTTAVERLVIMLEQREAREAADSSTREVAVAVDILGLRYRKIEQLEQEIQRIAQEEQYFPETLERMRMEGERLNNNGRDESGQLQDWAKNEIATNDALIRLEEERQKRVREQRIILENDLTKEQRRLTDVEAILDEWLDSL